MEIYPDLGTGAGLEGQQDSGHSRQLDITRLMT